MATPTMPVTAIHAASTTTPADLVVRNARIHTGDNAQPSATGQWVRVVGGWTADGFGERRLPTLAELNAAGLLYSTLARGPILAAEEQLGSTPPILRETDAVAESDDQKAWRDQRDEPVSVSEPLDGCF